MRDWSDILIDWLGKYTVEGLTGNFEGLTKIFCGIYCIFYWIDGLSWEIDVVSWRIYWKSWGVEWIFWWIDLDILLDWLEESTGYLDGLTACLMQASPYFNPLANIHFQEIFILSFPHQSRLDFILYKFSSVINFYCRFNIS